LGERTREAIAGYIFIAPAVALFGTFVLGPAVGAVLLSLFRWDLVGPLTFVGGQNFSRVVQDPLAWQALTNTLIFTSASVVLKVGGGLALALGANRSLPGPIRYFIRTAYFLPVVISWAAVSLIWSFLLDPDFGVVNYLLYQVGVRPPNWLVSRGWAMFGIVFVDFWHTVGFSFIVLLAALQAMPQELYEAAKIDGAGAYRRFLVVTVPLLSPTLLFVVIISFIAGFQVFDPVYIMTRGGPSDTTLSLVMHLFEKGFHQYDMGYAAALSVLILAALMTATLAQLGLSRSWVFYEGK